MVKDEIASVLNLAAQLSERVVGQNHALEMIAKRVQTARAGLDNPSKPIGVFMLAGPSGVGKTETALAIAETLYGGEQNIITINMSETSGSSHRLNPQGCAAGICRLRRGWRPDRSGPPASLQCGFVGRGRESAPGCAPIFFQVFDKGVMEDGEGRMIDFREEHTNSVDDQCRYRPDHEHVQGIQN